MCGKGVKGVIVRRKHPSCLSSEVDAVLFMCIQQREDLLYVS